MRSCNIQLIKLIFLIYIGIHDLLCPLTDLEIHALAKHLDPEDTGLIEYCGFEHGIHNRTLGDEDKEEQEVDDKSGSQVEEKLQPDDFVPEIVTTGFGGKKSARDPLHANYSRLFYCVMQ